MENLKSMIAEHIMKKMATIATTRRLMDKNENLVLEAQLRVEDMQLLIVQLQNMVRRTKLVIERLTRE
jgi:hypothetical protein